MKDNVAAKRFAFFVLNYEFVVVLGVVKNFGFDDAMIPKVSQ